MGDGKGHEHTGWMENYHYGVVYGMLKLLYSIFIFWAS